MWAFALNFGDYSMEGQPETGAVSKLTEVHQGYKSLLQDIQEFQLQRSDIENVDKFLRY